VAPRAELAWTLATPSKRGEVVFMGAGRTCSAGKGPNMRKVRKMPKAAGKGTAGKAMAGKAGKTGKKGKKGKN